MNESPFAPRTPLFAPPRHGYASIAPSCGVFGLVGGWLAADAFHLGTDQVIRWLLLLITPLVAAGLGRFLSSRLHHGPLTTATLLVAAVAMAGVLNGVLVGFFVAPPIGMVLGLAFGLICSVPFMPAVMTVAFAARRVGRARFQSIVDQADRRAVWLGTWVLLALGSSIPLPSSMVRGGGSALVPLASASFILVLVARDVGALLRVRGHGARAGAAREASTEETEPAVPTVDFGLGDEALVEIAPPGPVYRDRERSILRFRGSADRARAALGWAIGVDLMGFLVAVGCAIYRAQDLLRLPGGFVPPSESWD